MSSGASFFIAALYLITTVTLASHEYFRFVKGGGDSFTVVLAFVFINLLLPSIGIYALFGIYGTDLRTGVFFFDRTFDKINFLESLLIYFLTIIFIGGLYISAVLKCYSSLSIRYPIWDLNIRAVPAFLGFALLLIICGKFFIDLGGTFLERYVNLILFRNLDPSSNRTFFSANAFSLTQTLTWLSAAFSFIYLSKNKHLKGIFFLFVMLFAAFLMGSRRGFIFPIVILYFSVVLFYGRFELYKLILFVPLIILWVGFGKELTGAISNNFEVGVPLNSYESNSTMILRALADIGISQIESLAVLQNLDYYPRMGIDHLLSVLRRIPEGAIGLEIDWPERIVRITTEIFTSRDDADIPPGLLGQSWLDFPVLGAFLWGLFVGIQSRLLNIWAEKINKSPEKIVFVVLISLIICLPINTGSLDFTFSIDIIILFLLISIFFKRKLR